MDNATLFMTTLNQLFTGLDASMNKYTDDGRTLAGLLLVIVIAWDGIIGVLAGSGANEFLSKLIRHAITAGFVAAMLSGVVVESINSSFDVMADKIGGGKTSIGGAVASIQKTVVTIWNGKQASEAGANEAGANERFGQQIKDQVTGWWDTLTGGGLTQMALEFIMTALIVVVILICGAIFIGQFIITQVLLKLALIVMPVLVPWMIFSKTEFLFDGWLRFFLTAGMQKVVGAFFFSITPQLLEGASQIAASAEGPAGALGAYTLVLILSVAVAFLMLQTPSIAAGLISGHGGHGGGWLNNIPRPSPKPTGSTK